MIYLYGLFEGAKADLERALSGSNALQNKLEISAVGPWLLVHSVHDENEVLPKRRFMLAHTKVLEGMIAFGTVLPARFGLIADTLPKAIELIIAQESRVSLEFDRVRGRVELGVRVSFPRPSALDATLSENPNLRAERDALSQKGAEAHFAIADFGGRLADQLDRRRGHAQRALLDALTPLSCNHVLRKPEEDTEVLRAEFLVPSTDQDSFLTAVQKAADTLKFAPGSEPSIQIIGPVPMYNFVQLSLAVESDEMVA